MAQEGAQTPQVVLRPEAGIPDPKDTAALSRSSLLATLTAVGTAVAPDKDVPPEREMSARYLLSVFMIDVLLLGVGKIALFEVILTADSMGKSVVFVSLVLTSAETMVEFMSSAAVPRVYSWIMGTRVLTSRRLLHFAIMAYTASATMACIFYPLMGAVIGIADIKNNATLTLLALMQIVQYPVINQFGDQAIEMAMPHWLHTFKGLDLVFPGVPLARCAGCGHKSKSDGTWERNLRKGADSKSLAVFLTLVRFVLGAIFAIFYVLIRESSAGRWAVLFVLIAVASTAAATLLRNHDKFSVGIVDEAVEEEQDSTRWVWQMKGAEVSLIVWVTVVFKLPAQASGAVLTIMLLAVDLIGTAIYIIGSLVVLVYLYRLLQQSPKDTGASAEAVVPNSGVDGELHMQPLEGTEPPLEEKRWSLDLARGSWQMWQAKFFCITVLLCGAVFFLGAFSNVWRIYAAAVCILPYFTLRTSLQAQYESMLLQYGKGASDLVYWQNIFTMNVNAPLLALNWWMLEKFKPDDDDESAEDYEARQASIVMAVTVVILVAVLFFYLLVDWQLPVSSSAGKLVNETTRPKHETVRWTESQGSPLHSAVHETGEFDFPALSGSSSTVHGINPARGSGGRV